MVIQEPRLFLTYTCCTECPPAGEWVHTMERCSLGDKDE